MELYDQTPLRRAERELLDVDKAIEDVPAFTMTITLAGKQGTLVIRSGLDETKIDKHHTSLEAIGVAKLILAATDTLLALDLKDIVRNGIKLSKKPRKQRRRRQKNAEEKHLASCTAEGAKS